MRQKESVSLGPQYRGSKVSRAALEEESDEDEEEEDGDDDDDDLEGSEEFADPNLVDIEADEAAASDSEIESDNAFTESDAERLKDFVFRGSSKPLSNGKSRLKKRATAADFMSGSSDEGESEEALDESDMEVSDKDDMDDGLDALVDGGMDSEDDEEGSDAEDDGSEEDDEDDSQSDDSEAAGAKAAPKLAATSVNSARMDVEKGVAIQKQRKTYDELLNLRIRLQKALVAVNTFPTLEDDSEHTSEPYEAAEEAAINLLNTISNLKEQFGPASKAGSKRKRELDSSMSNDEVWKHLQADEPSFVRFRQDRLEKWSKKVQSATVTATSGLGSRNKTLIDSLDEQLGDPTSRLVKRTRVARSCAPAQVAKRVTEDDNIYDDADFYQLLLKELIEQRTIDTAGDQISAVPSVMLTASNAKTRKNVDRKASKGRKMRFTVHEKLQNFMAPEDRRTWEQGAIDRLFGTLFGQKMELDEGQSEDEDMEELKAQADGLRLFR